MSNSVRLLIACRVFIVIATERCSGKWVFLKNSWSIKLSASSLANALDVPVKKFIFLYNITNFTRKLTAWQVWRIFITVFEKAIFENAYWSIQYMYSYMWCVFRFDTICFIKKRQNHQWKGVIFEVSCERSQIAKHITYRLYI